MSHKTHVWLLVYLLALIASIALLIRAWNELSAVLLSLGVGLGVMACLGLIYVGIRVWLDLRHRWLDARAKWQQQQIEQEKHEAELRQTDTRLDLEQRRAWLEEHLALTRIPADAKQHFYVALPDGSGFVALPNLNHPRLPAARAQDAEPDKEGESDAIPTLVRYEEIRDQIPPGQALVGVSARGIETKDAGVRACLWIVGGSGSGKSNTLALRVNDLAARQHEFLGIDPHQFKEDSMTNSVKGYHSRFIMPIAQHMPDINDVLDAFLAEFFRRRDEGAPREQAITILIDEVGSLVSDVDKSDELEVEVARKLKETARICGQEARGFNMGGIFISQDAAGLSWLRKRALMILAHQVTMWSERLLVCNNDAKIARAMDTWPKGRTLAYGIAFPEGPQVVQQPLFTAHTVEATRYPPMPELPIKEQRAFLPERPTPKHSVSADETPPDVPSNIISMPFRVSETEQIPEGKNRTATVSDETKRTILKLSQDGVPLRKIAGYVGLAGEKYGIFKAVCTELGIRKAEEA